MYSCILAKKIKCLMFLLFIIGVLFIILSTAVYFWIGLLSVRAVPVICKNCEKPTKMLGRVDACMHCKQPLTLDKELEGKALDRKSTRLNSSHVAISYSVFCLNKKKTDQ